MSKVELFAEANEEVLKFKNLPLPEFGTALGVIYGIVDLGEQTSQWGTNHQIYVMFELPEDLYTGLDEDQAEFEGKPKVVGKFYNLKLKKYVGGKQGVKPSALRQLVEAIERTNVLPDSYGISNILGKAVLLSLGPKKSGEGTPEEHVIANIDGVMRLRGNDKAPGHTINPPLLYVKGQSDQETEDRVPGFLRVKLGLPALKKDKK